MHYDERLDPCTDLHGYHLDSVMPIDCVMSMCDAHVSCMRVYVLFAVIIPEVQVQLPFE